MTDYDSWSTTAFCMPKKPDQRKGANMSMERQFLRAKVRVMTVSEQFPKGKGYLFSNIAQHYSNDQLISLGQAVALLGDSRVVSYDATTTDHIAAD